MSTAGHGPCGWTLDLGVCSAVNTDAGSGELLGRVAAVAAEVLWRASGRRWGLCPLAVRPCVGGDTLPGGLYGPGGGWMRPLLDGGRWRNCPCGSCSLCELGAAGVRLPGIVHSVQAVVIDDVVLDPAAYRVRDHQVLARVDGGVWPATQRVDRETGPGTWSVTYTHGMALTPAAIHAYSIYTCELFKAASGQKCRLPARVEGIFRQGVNIDFADDNLDLLKRGRVGIPEVDAWLASVNPDGKTAHSQVYSPDLPRVTSTTWAPS